jgi:hypothetical protein
VACDGPFCVLLCTNCAMWCHLYVSRLKNTGIITSVIYNTQSYIYESFIYSNKLVINSCNSNIYIYCGVVTKKCLITEWLNDLELGSSVTIVSGYGLDDRIIQV